MTDNELIAEFMGATKQVVTDKKEGGYSEGTILWWNLFGEPGCIPHLEFDSSWDWLMPVVEKIETPEVNNDVIIRESADVTIFYKNCHIEYMTDDLDYDLHIDGVQGETKIEAVYKAVVEFIKWYNQNK